MALRQAKPLSESRWVMYCHKCRWMQSIGWTLTACQCGNVAAHLREDSGLHVVVIANQKQMARVIEITTLLEKHWALIQKVGELPGVSWCRERQRAIDEGWKLVEDFVKPRKIANPAERKGKKNERFKSHRFNLRVVPVRDRVRSH